MSLWKKFLIWQRGTCVHCKLEPKTMLSSSYCELCTMQIMHENCSECELNRLHGWEWVCDRCRSTHNLAYTHIKEERK